MTRRRGILLIGLLVALALAGGVSYYASASPDGLEKVATDQDFADRAEEHPLDDSPVADYSTRGVDDDRLAGGLAGVLGVLATFAIGGAVFWLVRRRSAAGGGPAGGDAARGPAGGGPPGGDAARGSAGGGPPDGDHAGEDPTRGLASGDAAGAGAGAGDRPAARSGG
jgi:cobalt/nickel transport system permease protein